MTGIELLQMIKNNEVEEGTEIDVLRVNEESCCFDVVAKLKYNNNDLFWSPGTFRSSMLWDNDYLFEIVESKEVPNKITGVFQYSRLPSYFRDEETINSVNCNFEQHQKAINELIYAVNYLLDTQNKG